MANSKGTITWPITFPLSPFFDPGQFLFFPLRRRRRRHPRNSVLAYKASSGNHREWSEWREMRARSSRGHERRILATSPASRNCVAPAGCAVCMPQPLVYVDVRRRRRRRLSPFAIHHHSVLKMSLHPSPSLSLSGSLSVKAGRRRGRRRREPRLLATKDR